MKKANLPLDNAVMIEIRGFTIPLYVCICYDQQVTTICTILGSNYTFKLDTELQADLRRPHLAGPQGHWQFTCRTC